MLIDLRRARLNDSDKRFALITQLYGDLATVHSDCLTILEKLNQGTTAAKNQRGLAKVVRSLRDARIAREASRVRSGLLCFQEPFSVIKSASDGERARFDRAMGRQTGHEPSRDHRWRRELARTIVCAHAHRAVFTWIRQCLGIAGLVKMKLAKASGIGTPTRADF